MEENDKRREEIRQRENQTKLEKTQKEAEENMTESEKLQKEPSLTLT